MNNKELNARLRKANPVPSDPTPPRRASSIPRRAGQLLVVVSAALLIGVGATWAATGSNPIASVFTKDLRVDDSTVGIDSFSILRPVTREDLDSLPRGIAMRTHFRASSNTIQRNIERGLPPFGHPKPTRQKPFRPDPAMISAIGYGQTNEGNDFTMLVIDDEICAFLGRGFGFGNCGSLEMIEQDSMIGAYPEPRNLRLTRILGIATDEVASIKVAGSDAPPIPVPDNAFEIGNLPPEDITVLGLNEEGEELFRERIPISFYASH